MALQEKQLYVDAEKLCAEHDVFALKEKELENDFEIKKLQQQQQLELRKIELQFEKEREEREFQLRKLELELKAKTAEIPIPVSLDESLYVAPVFDVYKNIRLVPPFLEKEVEKYFQHFERVAVSLKWPKVFWTLLLQCVLVGSAQEVYSALTTEQSSDYEIVKSAILHAYELAPEAYRQKFRTLFKSEKCTYLEFARVKENMFDRWCSSVKVTTKEQLRVLILLEEFKNCVPNAVAMYLNENKVTKLSDAALMADEFVLTHVPSVPSVDDQTDNSASMFERPFIWDDHVNICSLSPLYSVETRNFETRNFETQNELIKAQRADETFEELFSLVVGVAGGGNKFSLPYYFLQDGLLCRQQPVSTDSALDPRIQIIVPLTFRHAVLQLSHQGLVGHMGVRKTYDRILRKFYWPRIKRDVVNYIRSCHICQMTGKPNQKVPLAPLQPIAVVTTPFEHLIIDCVGPLPRSKAGHAYMLTVMCQSTRYPAAYPLRSITTKSILKALTSFISVFGTIQSDQGSNFMSRQFSKVMQQLKVKHSISSAYHPQSQGVLERFHQTLKSLLRSYCVELDCDWEDGLPWMLLAIREVVQENTGFSPNELAFGHTVRGPIALLADEWRTSDPPENVLDYVSSFRYRLYEARAIALRKLVKTQKKMQRLFDRKVQQEVFR